jgi:hypothetical protein
MGEEAGSALMKRRAAATIRSLAWPSPKGLRAWAMAP